MTSNLIPIVVAILLAFVTGARSQTVALTVASDPAGVTYSPTDVVLEAGDFAVVETILSTIGGMSLVIEMAGKEYVISGANDPKVGWKIAGPARIRARVPAAPVSYGFVTITIQRAAAQLSVTPAGAAVIPEEPAGQFKVILESSTDMITWTPANPGTYGGNTVKRFFRTRIEKL